MGIHPLTVKGYIVRVGGPSAYGADWLYLAAVTTEDKHIAWSGLALEWEKAKLFATREEAESAALQDGAIHPDRLGHYEVDPVYVGFAIKGRVRAKKRGHYSNTEYAMIEGYLNPEGNLFPTLDEAPKFRTREIAETLAFNMTIKDGDLIGTLEIIEIPYVARA